jgi:hypothetical protein
MARGASQAHDLHAQREPRTAGTPSCWTTGDRAAEECSWCTQEWGPLLVWADRVRDAGAGSDLVILVEGADVVLEGVRDPAVAYPDV